MKRWFPSVGDAKIPVKINDQKSFNTRCSRWASVMLVIAVLAFSIYDIVRWIKQKDVILEEKSLPISEFFPNDRVDKYHVEMVRQLNLSIPRFGPDHIRLTDCRAKFRYPAPRMGNFRNLEQFLPCKWDVYEMKCEKCVPVIVPEKLEVVGLQSSGCAYEVNIRRFGNMVETYNDGTTGERKCTNDRNLNQKANSWALWFEAVWQPRFKDDEMPPERQDSGDPSCALLPVQRPEWHPNDSTVMDDCEGCRWFTKYRSSRIVRDKDQGIITDDQVLISTTLWREISDNIFEITPLVVEKMDPWLNIRNVSREIAFEVSRTISMKESRKTQPQRREEGFKYRLRVEYSRTYKKLIMKPRTILEMIANIGGFASVCFAMRIFLKFYNQHRLESKLQGESIDFQELNTFIKKIRTEEGKRLDDLKTNSERPSLISLAGGCTSITEMEIDE